MEYMGNVLYWDRKFENRGTMVLPPESLLLTDIEDFQFGRRGLELACGDGRNLIPLAKRGYEMTGVDFSSVALGKLRKLAEDSDVEINTYQADLSEKGCFSVLPVFDFVVINHYRLCPDFYEELMLHLEKGGYLWVNGFFELPGSNPDITPEDLLSECDFASIRTSLFDVKYYEDRERHFVRYCFRK